MPRNKQHSHKDAKTAQTEVVSRRKLTKSRNGCVTCKASRRKCDETKPACLQCTRRNRDCPGYPPPSLKWSVKYEKLCSESTYRNAADEEITKLLNECLQDVGSRSEVDETFLVGLTDFGFSIQNNEYLPLEATRYISAASDDRQMPEALAPPSDPGYSGHSPLTEKTDGSYSWLSDEVILWPLPSTAAEATKLIDRSSNPPASPLSSSTSLVSQPVHIPSFLTRHWFDRVCVMLSSFDSEVNPLRIKVARLWQSSSSLYFSMQSMAAVSLKEQLPRIGAVARQAKAEAVAALHRQMLDMLAGRRQGFPEDLMMACILLGLSGPWNNHRDLGLVYLKTANGLLSRAENRKAPRPSCGHPELEFYRKSLIHWEMLVAAAGPISTDRISSFKAALVPVTNRSDARCCSIRPHPWTGVATTAQYLLGRVLVLTRAQTLPVKEINFSNTKAGQALAGRHAAQDLEEAILELESPCLRSVQETKDSRTPSSHQVAIAEAYRIAALLQLYSAFPTLAWMRLGILREALEAETESWLRSLAIFGAMHCCQRLVRRAYL